MHNEWRGSYDEFEEAVEFGELELFLGIENAQQEQTSAHGQPTEVHAAQLATSSKDPSLYPVMNFAPQGSGKRDEPTADDLLASLGLKDADLTEADADAILASLDEPTPVQASKEPSYRYVPSADAITKPLRLARMGSASPKSTPGSPSTTSAGQSSRSPSIARYSVSQRSGKALAAEATALVSGRKTSGALLREAVSQGKDLDEAMKHSKMSEAVANEDIDHLFASLGLKDVDLSGLEVDEFLESGVVPEGLITGGSRLGRAATLADKARNEVAAREVAHKAREKGYGKLDRKTALSNSGSLKSLDESPEITTDTIKSEVDSTDKEQATKDVPEVPEPDEAIPGDSSIVVKSDLEENEAEVKADERPTMSQAALPKSKDVDAASKEEHSETSSNTHGDADQSILGPATTLDAEQSTEAQEIESSGPSDSIAVQADSAADTDPITSIPNDGLSEASQQIKIPDASPPDSVSQDDEIGTPAEKTQHLDASSLPSPVAKDDEKDASDGPTGSDVDPNATAPDASESTEAEADQTIEDGEAQDDSKPSESSSEAPVQPQEPVDSHKDEIAGGNSDPGESLPSNAIPATQVTDAGNAQGGDIEQNVLESQTVADEMPVATQIETDDSPEGQGSKSPDQPVSVAPTNDMPAQTPEKKKELPVAATSPTGNRLERKLSPINSEKGQFSTRKALDGARRNDQYPSSPPISPPADMKKKRVMSIKSFGLGKDKDRENKPASPRSPGFRHERTISQILREADAALQMDDDYGLDNDDDADDDKIFGGQ